MVSTITTDASLVHTSDQTSAIYNWNIGPQASWQYFKSEIDGVLTDQFIVFSNQGVVFVQIDPTTGDVVSDQVEVFSPANYAMGTTEDLEVFQHNGVTYMTAFTAQGETGGWNPYTGQQVHTWMQDPATGTWTQTGSQAFGDLSEDTTLTGTDVLSWGSHPQTFTGTDGNTYAWINCGTNGEANFHLSKVMLDPATGTWVNVANPNPDPADVTTNVNEFSSGVNGLGTSSLGEYFRIDDLGAWTEYETIKLVETSEGPKLILTGSHDPAWGPSTDNMMTIVNLDPVDGSIRWNPDGTMDATYINLKSFGGEAAVSTSFMGGVGDVQVDANGNIIVAGRAGYFVIDPTDNSVIANGDLLSNVANGYRIFEDNGLLYISNESETTIIDTSDYSMVSQADSTDQITSFNKEIIQSVNGTYLAINMNQDTTSYFASTVGVDPAPVCFVRGTLISTSEGQVSVEQLSVGDLVETADHGLQPIRWIGSTSIQKNRTKINDRYYPVRIRAGALGNGKPESDLYLSQQHRVLVRSKIAMRIVGQNEVLIPAKKLLGHKGIELATDFDEVEYFHVLFDQHQIVTSNGAQTESLYTGEHALDALQEKSREEIFSLFPELKLRDHNPNPVRTIPNGRLANKVASRHINKNHPFV